MTIPPIEKIPQAPRPTILEVIGRDQQGRRRVRCLCRCGVIFEAAHYEVTKGGTHSCGCYHKQRTIEACVTHGGSKRAEFRIWATMRERCGNPNNTGYHKYGGRGIRVCDEWQESFAAFMADMGTRPDIHHSIERRDNDGPYNKDNCYWATAQQQARNRRSSVFVTVYGVKMLLIEACEKYGIPYPKAHQRMYKGWTAERTFEVEA